MRTLGVDYGEKRIGLALSDPLGIIASPFAVYERKNEDADLNYFADVIKQNSVSKVVVGLPKNMDGTEGKSADKARELGEKIGSAFNIPVFYRDERLSSVAANRVLDEAEMHWSKRNKVVDKLAAVIILQSFLDTKR